MWAGGGVRTELGNMFHSVPAFLESAPHLIIVYELYIAGMSGQRVTVL